ncbi:hypothetical protein ACFQU7_31345 [Pseudoroseomonas wenyumeiae]
MRILIYNFVQPGASKSRQGGGVAIYQDNLIKALKQQGHAPIVMSCGDRYSLHAGRAFLTTQNDGFERAVIVNSPSWRRPITPSTGLSAIMRIPASITSRLSCG